MEQTAKTNLELVKNEGNQEAKNNTWGARTFLHKKAQPKHAEKSEKICADRKFLLHTKIKLKPIQKLCNQRKKC